MITVNGYAFADEDLWRLLRQVLWKQVSGSLNTTEGCRDAANGITGFLAAIGPEYHPHGKKEEMPFVPQRGYGSLSKAIYDAAQLTMNSGVEYSVIESLGGSPAFRIVTASEAEKIDTMLFQLRWHEGEFYNSEEAK